MLKGHLGNSNHLSFLHSKSYYIILLIACIGVQADYALTIQGLLSGYSETREFFWLHFAGLGTIVTAIYFVMYRHNKNLASYTSLAFVTIMVSLPIVSNTLVLLTGSSPIAGTNIITTAIGK